MKVIFLDVDGVLNDAFTEDITPEGFIGLDKPMIEQLARIVEQTGASIVLSSSWKADWNPANPSGISEDVRYLMDRLGQHGLSLLDKTYDDEYRRGEGIHNWLCSNADKGIESFVVLDDVRFYDFESFGLLPHFVKTSYGCGGLTMSLADQAIAILNDRK